MFRTYRRTTDEGLPETPRLTAVWIPRQIAPEIVSGTKDEGLSGTTPQTVPGVGVSVWPHPA